jgi:hypothetical protein
MTDEWKPNKELIDWAKGHFSQMSVGGVWMPEGSGLTYVKVDEKKWRLKSMIDTDESKANHDRMKMLMWDVGIVIIDDEPSMLPVPTSAEEAYMQEVHMKREIAQSWADKDGTLLVEMGLEEVYPEYIEDKEILLENGDVQNVEIWAYKPTNSNTGEQLSIDPDDYHLLMGDEYFMRFKHAGIVYTALSRQAMVEAVDAGEKGIGVGSKMEGGKVPPWMWGTYCSLRDGSEEE